MRQFVLPTLAGLAATVVITLCVQGLFDTRADLFGVVALIGAGTAAAAGLVGGLGAGLTTWVLLRGGRKAVPK